MSDIYGYVNGHAVKSRDDFICINAAYGNGTGSYSKSLYSDESIKDSCFGYLD